MVHHSPQQQVKEAKQIAKDHHLIISEKKIGDRTDYLLFRCSPSGNIFIGKRGSPEGIRSFVAKAANFR